MADPKAPARIHARARELSRRAGYASPHVTQSAYEQAKREVMGDPAE